MKATAGKKTVPVKSTSKPMAKKAKESSSSGEDDSSSGGDRSSSDEDDSKSKVIVNSRNKSKAVKGNKTVASKINKHDASMSAEEQEVMNKVMMTETSVELSMIQDKLE